MPFLLKSRPVPNTMGLVESIAGLQCYIARPIDTGITAEPLGVILLLPGPRGWKDIQGRLEADFYARSTPAVVVLPNLTSSLKIPPALSHLHPAPLLRLLRTLRTFPVSPTNTITTLNRIALSSPPSTSPLATRLARGVSWGAARRAGMLEQLVDCLFIRGPKGRWRGVVVPVSAAVEGRKGVLRGQKAVEKDIAACHGCEVRVYNSKEDDGVRGGRAKEQAVEWFQRHLQVE